MFKKVGIFIAGFVVGTVVISGWGQIFNNDTTDVQKALTEHDTLEVAGGELVGQDATVQEVVQDTKVSTAQSTNEAIVVEAQVAGSSVMVKNVNLQAGANGGWVVIHEVKSGVIANALGAVRRDAGAHAGVEIKLLRGTVAGGTYAVVLYSDNGDRQFNLETDAPLKSSDGAFIMSTFSAK